VYLIVNSYIYIYYLFFIKVKLMEN